MGLMSVQGCLVGVHLSGGNVGWVGVAASWQAVRLHAVRFAFPLRWQQALAVCREGRKRAGSLPARAHFSAWLGKAARTSQPPGSAAAWHCRLWINKGFLLVLLVFLWLKVKKQRSPSRFVRVGELLVGRKLLWFVSRTMTGADLTRFWHPLRNW